MDYKKLADILFPKITKTPEDYEALYPPRDLPDQANVTRLGPSPTGFIHLGNLYGAFVDERLARQSGGTFYLRIEDTDDKRLVEGAVETILSSLKFFGIEFDEGAGTEKHQLDKAPETNQDRGNYGPYYQSKRAEIYQCYIKELIKAGKAYPCFLTEAELADIRSKQEEKKQTPGIYGKWASGRDLSLETIESNIAAGKRFVIRLYSSGKENPGTAEKITARRITEEAVQKTVDRITIIDGIRGKLSMQANFQDVVILKASGIPTYHFAHVVDDHLMRTTHVVRGEEWLSSLPIHVELFEALGFELPVYCHTAQLMKLEDGNKRKLSKRKDPELSLDYYRKEGYLPLAVQEYLLTILNSDYEQWRADNPDTHWKDFPFQVEKMSTSGALFDLDKLNDVSKDVLIKVSAPSLCDFMKKWAQEFRPEILPLFEDQENYIEKILDLGRTGNKPRKDLVFARQIFDFVSYFFDDYFQIRDPDPENAAADAKEILRRYLETYDFKDDQSLWFDKIRTIAEDLNYAARPKDYKKNPDQYKGHVGDVSTVIRIALTGRSQSPDIWEIQQILGEKRTRARLESRICQLP